MVEEFPTHYNNDYPGAFFTLVYMLDSSYQYPWRSEFYSVMSITGCGKIKDVSNWAILSLGDRMIDFQFDTLTLIIYTTYTFWTWQR